MEKPSLENQVKLAAVNEEYEKLAEHMDNAQKTMYGPLLAFWTNQKAISKLTSDYAVCTWRYTVDFVFNMST